ncbi:MAG: CotH kinase family protein [Ignavibacteriaceae bacterium]|nr:CotH kinase family protein [Ignavibacteriaceae bacterium]
MKLTSTISGRYPLLLFVLFSFTLQAQNAGDVIFAGTQVHTIKFQFKYANYWDSLTYYYNLGTEEYIPAAVTINGVLFDSVGVRFKGNSSFSHPNNKKSLRISFDEYVSTFKWDGEKGIHLNNFYGDPSFIREKVMLDFCRDAGINAPRANYANVYINDTLFAFYSLIEHVDKRLLSSRFGVNSGDLFKAVDAFEGLSAASDFKWYSAVPDSYYTRYEMKTDESTTAWPALIKLLDSLNNNSNTISALPFVVNLNSVYKAFAADIIFGNLDSYINSGRNFYFYFNPLTSKMEWIMWDVGLGFGVYSGGVSNFENLSVTYVLNQTQRPLFAKILNTIALKNEYLRNLCLIFTGYFNTTRLFPKIDSIANTIRPYVYADSRKQYTNNQFEINIQSDLNIQGVAGTNRIPGIKSFISARQTSVQNQLTALGVNCSLTVSRGDVVINEFLAQNSTIPDPAGQYDDWVELYNNTNHSVDLGGMYLSDSYTSPQKWTFPSGTTIDAGAYLVVWADEDAGQPGLHASFKISASGEQLILSNTDGSLLDTVKFGAQTSDVSMSRIPNGTGGFVFTTPTIGAANIGTSDAEETAAAEGREFILYHNNPNPFNSGTNINFFLPRSSEIEFRIYDALGREVKAYPFRKYPSGRNTLLFNAGSLPGGVYFVRAKFNGRFYTQQIMHIK